MASGSNSRGLVLLLITSCFFITGILFDYMPMIIDDHIKRTIELATNDEIVAYWTRPPVDVNSYYWLYEIVNADEFQYNGEKAQVRQLGPFHFVSRLEKRIVGLSANKFRITYNSTRLMRLNESSSIELLDRPITVANPLYSSVLEGVRINAAELDPQSRTLAYGTVSRLTDRYNESILDRNTTARRALLGRPMPILTKLAKMAQTMGLGARMPELPSASSAPDPGAAAVGSGHAAAGGSNATPAASGPLYGYASLQNNTLTGPFEIYTGYQETARSLGELISYKGKRRLNYYDGKCNRMQTSAGELRPMPIDPERRLEMFQPAFCRIIHLEPTGQQKLREGVAVSYTLLADDFASASNNPDNRCFCVNSSGPGAPTDNSNRLDDNHCSLDGVIDLGPCSFGAPLLVAPSSLQLDSRIINSLGNDFDPELLHGEMNEIDLADDKSQVVILKRIGLPIRADITLTMFLRLVRDPAFKETATVPDVSYLPLVTIRESITIPPKLAQIIINLESFISLTYHIKVIMYLSAVVLLFWLSGHYYGLTSESMDEQHNPQNRRRVSEVDSGRRSGGGGGESAPGGGQTGPPGRRATLASVGGSGGGATGTGSMRAEPAGNGLQEAAGQQQSAGSASARRSNGSLKTETTNRQGDDRTAPPPASSRMSQSRGSLLLLSGPRALDTVQEVSSAKIREAAAPSSPDDTTSSERANSADSSRSLPPSRHTSRLNSLSQASGELEAASGERPPNSASGNGTDSDAATSKGTTSTRPPARIFSKVDEQLESRRCRKSRVAADAPKGSGQDESTNGDERPETEGHAVEQGRPSARRKRKNWFMGVYSNLVQMLNGLRGTINEVGRLDLENHSHQDKRLELLAGKIDNWYNSNGDELASGGPGEHEQAKRIGSGLDRIQTPPPATAGGQTGDESSAAAGLSGSAGVQMSVSAATGAGRESRPGSRTKQTAAAEADRQTESRQPNGSHSATTTSYNLGGGQLAVGRDGNRVVRVEPSDRMIANGTEAAVLSEHQPDTGPSRGPPLEASAGPLSAGNEGGAARTVAGLPSEQLVSDSSGGGLEDDPSSGQAKTQANELSIAAPPASSSSSPKQAAALPTAEQSELDPTERNGLNSRSMRVESSRAIDDGKTAATTTEVVAKKASESPVATATTNTSTVSGRQHELEAKARGQSVSQSSEFAAAQATAAEVLPSSIAAAVTADEETETETETETEAEAAANELAKANTLDRIEAALNGSEDEFVAVGAAEQQAQSPLENGLGPLAADDGKRPTVINSSASLDSVIDLETSPTGATTNGGSSNQSGGGDLGRRNTDRMQLPSAATFSANGQSAVNQSAANKLGSSKTIDGHNPADRLRQSNGLNPSARVGQSNGLPPPGQQSKSLRTGAGVEQRGTSANEITISPSSPKEKLVADDDGGRKFNRQVELAKTRAENSLKSPVSNLSLKSSGREQRLRGGGELELVVVDSSASDQAHQRASGIGLASDEGSKLEHQSGDKNDPDELDKQPAGSSPEAVTQQAADNCNPQEAITTTISEIQSHSTLSVGNRREIGFAGARQAGQSAPSQPVGEVAAEQQVAKQTCEKPARTQMRNSNTNNNSDSKQPEERQIHHGDNNGQTLQRCSTIGQRNSGAVSLNRTGKRRPYGAGLAAAGNNLHDSNELDGNNILNRKIISHYTGQVARAADVAASSHSDTRRLTDDRRPATGLLHQVANHKQNTGNHHHQQRPVQPAGA